MPPNYQNGKVYALRSHQTPEIYIGSTTQPLHVRFGEHKRSYKKFKNGKTNYTSSFKLLDYDDCYIELVQKYPCNDRNELNKREGEVIRETYCVNKYVAGRSYQEYREENKQEINNKKKAYYRENKQEINNKQKQKFNCECGGRYTLSHKSNHFKTKIHRNFIENNSER